MSAFEYPAPRGLKKAPPADEARGGFNRRSAMKSKPKAPPMPAGKGKGKKPC